MPGFEVVGEEERKAVDEVFADGGVLFRHGFDAMRNGRYRVRELEEAFAEWLGVRHALCVSSGTAALKVGLKALGVGPGDEVVTQSFTFIATAEVIADCGARPVFVEIDETLNMDPDALAAAITPRTRAIVPVHMLGVSADMDAIVSVAGDIPVFDDACEALGAGWGSGKAGTQGTAAAWSFDHGKMLTTGEGGAVTTDDDELARRAREYHDHGHENNPAVPRGRDTRSRPGFNFRMSELQGAVGGAQLRKLDGMIEANRRSYARIEQALQGIDGIEMRRVPAASTPAADTLIFLLPDRDTATRFVAGMSEEGLGTKNLPDAIDWHFAGTWTHMLGDFGLDEAGLAEATRRSDELLRRAVAVPILVNYTDERVDEIAAALQKIATEAL